MTIKIKIFKVNKCHILNLISWTLNSKKKIRSMQKSYQNFLLKGVFAKNERGYRLNAIKKRF